MLDSGGENKDLSILVKYRYRVASPKTSLRLGKALSDQAGVTGVAIPWLASRRQFRRDMLILSPGGGVSQGPLRVPNLRSFSFISL